MKEYRSGRVIKSSEPESLTDWNTLELIASGRDSAQIVNGRWVNGATAIEADSGDGWGGLSHGHLALQAEGAEVFFRALEVRPLAYLPPPPEATCALRRLGRRCLAGARRRDGGLEGGGRRDGGGAVRRRPLHP